MPDGSDRFTPPVEDEETTDDADVSDEELVEGDLLTLLDHLQEELLRGGRIPMTNKLLADEEAVYAVLDQIRTSGQAGIERAQWFVQHRTQILEHARKEAMETLDQAAAEADALTSPEGLQRLASQRANELIAQATAEVHAIEGAADAYASQALHALRDCLLQVQGALHGIATQAEE